jgi:hypothetical protein
MEDQNFSYDLDCLLMFVDDTGHERLKGHPMYGLGGCAVLGRDYQRVIVEPWLRRRAGTTGSAETPLHAADFGRIASKANMAAMNRFFRTQPFFRFAALGTLATKHPRDRELMAWVIDVLKQRRLLEIVNRTPARSVALIFETSQRSDKLLMEYFGQLHLSEDGKEIPVHQFLMPKDASEPGLEVADFVINPAGRYARHRFFGNAGFPPDFEAVFHKCDRVLTSFICVENVELSDPSETVSPP